MGDTVILDMAMEAMEVMDTMARGLLMLRPAMDMAMDMAMEATDMDMASDMVMDMDMVMVIDTARGLLMLRPAMDMAMDMVMEAMDTDTMDKRTRQKKFHTENNTKSSASIS